MAKKVSPNGVEPELDVDFGFDDEEPLFDDELMAELPETVGDQLDPIVVSSTEWKTKHKTTLAKRSRTRTKPQQWDDDWCDPADDLMYGFDDTLDN